MQQAIPHPVLSKHGAALLEDCGHDAAAWPLTTTSPSTGVRAVVPAAREATSEPHNLKTTPLTEDFELPQSLWDLVMEEEAIAALEDGQAGSCPEDVPQLPASPVRLISPCAEPSFRNGIPGAVLAIPRSMLLQSQSPRSSSSSYNYSRCIGKAPTSAPTQPVPAAPAAPAVAAAEQTAHSAPRPPAPAVKRAAEGTAPSPAQPEEHRGNVKKPRPSPEVRMHTPTQLEFPTDNVQPLSPVRGSVNNTSFTGFDLTALASGRSHVQSVAPNSLPAAHTGKSAAPPQPSTSPVARCSVRVSQVVTLPGSSPLVLASLHLCCNTVDVQGLHAAGRRPQRFH